MSIAVDYERLTREKARLVILQELSRQTRESLSTPYFSPSLELAAIYQDAPWVNQEIEYLRNMGGVVVLDVDGETKIATLTDRGRRHLDRHIVIPGVERPRRSEA